MIPTICVILFAILGSWILIDPVPGHILLNFPEFVGRLAFIVWYNIVSIQFIFNMHVRLMPIRSIIFYSDMLEEAILMSETPLGGFKDDE